MRHGGALEPGVRSVGRSGFASEVRPCLSCCTERAYEVTSSPGIWKQRRLPVPPAAPMDHAPWCGGRVAPSPGTRAAIVAFGVSCEADLGQNGPCGILLKTKPSQKKQASNAHRGGGVPSVKSYVAVCSNPLVHGGRRASSHWLLLAPTPVVDLRVHHTRGSSCCCWVLTFTVPWPTYPLPAPYLRLPPPSCGSL